jgi:glycosyltransferase involved in cell wall biosynthesis
VSASAGKRLREGSLVDTLMAKLAAVTGQAENAQARLYEAYAADNDPLRTGRDPSYRRMVADLRDAVREHVPRDATVLAISRGDDDLVDLYGREAWHFPRSQDGRYAGYYPHEGRAAVAQLESQHAFGADFLLIPATAGWWLERYPELSAHLGATATPVFSTKEVGQLFDLRHPAREGGEDWLSALEAVLSEIESLEGDDPSVLDWTGELDLAASLPHRGVLTPISWTATKQPYASRSIEVVVMTGNDDQRRTEARRIARTAVVRLGEHGSRTSLTLEWQAAEWKDQPQASILVSCTGPYARLVFQRVLIALPSRIECEVVAVVSGREPPWLRTYRSDNRVTVVRARTRSLAIAYEEAARAAKARTLVLLRPGVIPLRNWLLPLLRTKRTRADAKVVGGLALSQSGCIAEAGGILGAGGSLSRLGADDFTIDAPSYSFVRSVDFCSAGVVAIEREEFLRLGGLDARYTTCMPALADLCLRATKRGARVYYQPESASVTLPEAPLSENASHNGHGAVDSELLKRSWWNTLRRQRSARNGSSAHLPGLHVAVREPRRALVVARRPPEPDRESGSRRVHHLIGLLRDSGWEITFGADEDYGAERGIRRLRQEGIETYVPMRDRLDELLTPNRFDLALTVFWQNAERLLPRIRAACPDTRVVVDMVDLHLLRAARDLLKDSPATLLDHGFALDAAREINAYALADTVLAVSDKEAELVNDLTAHPGRALVVPDLEELPRSPIRRRDRRGIVFLGNFWHPPNRDALRFLLNEIVPQLDQRLLKRHPIRVVGNKLEEFLPDFGRIPDGVQLVGWVPSVAPYLEHARVSVIPLRTGAGTKRKLVQALMIGTPTVSTSVGIEGIPVHGDDHVLVADDPTAFAVSIERLLTDDQLWSRIARQGRRVALTSHGRDIVTRSLDDALESTFSRPAASAGRDRLQPARSVLSSDYERTVEDLGEAVEKISPEGATVFVVSRGDPELVRFHGRAGRHFPEDGAGAYAGYHPADGRAAVAFLDDAIGKGAGFLALPSTSFWWLGRYPELQERLESLGGRVWSSEYCIVWALSRDRMTPRQPAGEITGEKASEELAVGEQAQEITPELVESRRPSLSPSLSNRPPLGAVLGQALVIGIYLSDRPNNVVDIVSCIKESAGWGVTQRWIALGQNPPPPDLADLTVRAESRSVPKFELLNALLADQNLGDYDYVLVIDDDIVLPRGFIDAMLPLQHELDFALAQPSRTSCSYIDHPIVEQQRGALARRTRFVEIGPVFSVHRSAFDLVFPFDPASPMGWGYENVWAYKLEQSGQRMGILDAVSVDHGLRKPVANYSWHSADDQRRRYLNANPHLTLEECFRVLELFPLETEFVA